MVRFLSNDQIREEADRFLAENLGEIELPIPIELLIEKATGIEIIPVPGWQEREGIVGALSVDRTTLWVDEWTMIHRIPRYNFTLAHELGHYVLHADFLEQLRDQGIENWKHVMKHMPPKDYQRYEFQAQEFAGCVLVPREQLLDAFDDACDRYRDAIGTDIDELQDYEYVHAVKAMTPWIAERFEVSHQVIEIRLKVEDILPCE